MKTLKELAAEALAVQGTSNLLGVSNSYAKMIPELRAALVSEKKFGDDYGEHPIHCLWVSKLSQFAGKDISLSAWYVEAEFACKEMVAGK